MTPALFHHSTNYFYREAIHHFHSLPPLNVCARVCVLVFAKVKGYYLSVLVTHAFTPYPFDPPQLLSLTEHQQQIRKYKMVDAVLANSPVVAVAAYCISSIVMTLGNKFVLSGQNFNLNCVVLAVQSLSCLAIIASLKCF